MTPDQYRREGAEAMRKAALEACEDYAPERNIDFPTDPFIAQITQVTHSMDRIRAIAVDEVLAGMRPRCAECDCEDGNCTWIKAGPAPDAVARLVEAANQARLALAGYVSAQSAIDKLDAALAQKETNHD